MMILSMIFGDGLLVYQLFQISKIENIKKWSSDRMAPWFLTLSMVTNVATAYGFGKPRTGGGYLSMLVFGLLMVLCVKFPGLWDWCEKSFFDNSTFWSKKVSSKFGVYKFLVFSEILGHNFNPPILNCTDRDF
jgi:hypothetical protein